MTRHRLQAALFAAWSSLLSCAPSGGASLEPAQSAVADLTVSDASQNAFSMPMAGLSETLRAQFFVGNSLFNQNWVSAPATAASRDGLGPLFNARSCSGCHFKDGRGRPPEAGAPLRSALVRVSVPGRGPHGEPLADARYGDQLQSDAIEPLRPEARVDVRYDELTGTYADGTPYSLRVPRVRVVHFEQDAPASTLLLSLRVAPQLVGLGLLQAVSDSTLEALADPEDRDGDGISGRINRVYSRERSRMAIGRFGWKSEQPSLLEQTAAAFLGDMGITTRLFPHEACADLQMDCRAQPNGGEPELEERGLRSVVSYLETLAPPAARAQREAVYEHGRALFERASCSACHLPTLQTGADVPLALLRDREFAPFTDLLLHDMGELLADDRPSFEASGREWRTAPLWGLGLVPRVNGHSFYLHDGRARDLGEAILFHGGEAERARAAFVSMHVDERSALIRYLESL